MESINIFDLPGPEFLVFYLALIAVGGIFAGFVRWRFRFPADPPEVMPTLDCFETAYLARGRTGAIDTALVGLVHRGCLKVSMSRIRKDDVFPRDLHAVENYVYGRCANGPDNTLFQVRRAPDDLLQPMKDKLQSLGLALPPGSRFTSRVTPILIMLAVLVIGIIKIGVGISRDRPVDYLVILCMITLVLAVQFARPVWRTRRGDAVLRELKYQNAALRAQTGVGRRVEPDLAAMAFALYGPGTLNRMSDAGSSLYKILSRQSQSGGGGAGCGGAGCGGGGGGCGGCGGGGH